MTDARIDALESLLDKALLMDGCPAHPAYRGVIDPALDPNSDQHCEDCRVIRHTWKRVQDMRGLRR